MIEIIMEESLGSQTNITYRKWSRSEPEPYCTLSYVIVTKITVINEKSEICVS